MMTKKDATEILDSIYFSYRHPDDGQVALSHDSAISATAGAARQRADAESLLGHFAEWASHSETAGYPCQCRYVTERAALECP